MTNNAPSLTSQRNGSSVLVTNDLHAPPSLPNDILNFSIAKFNLLEIHQELIGVTISEMNLLENFINNLLFAIQDYQSYPSVTNSHHMHDSANSLLYGGFSQPNTTFTGLIEIIDRHVTNNPAVPSSIRLAFGVRTTVIPAISVNTFSVNNEVIFGLRSIGGI